MARSWFASRPSKLLPTGISVTSKSAWCLTRIILTLKLFATSWGECRAISGRRAGDMLGTSGPAP
eukprot:2632956-Alexandrium_andersonii.AAC.1